MRIAPGTVQPGPEVVCRTRSLWRSADANTGIYRPRNCGGRFSKKARMPSSLSSVA